MIILVNFANKSRKEIERAVSISSSWIRYEQHRINSHQNWLDVLVREYDLQENALVITQFFADHDIRKLQLTDVECTGFHEDYKCLFIWGVRSADWSERNLKAQEQYYRALLERSLLAQQSGLVERVYFPVNLTEWEGDVIATRQALRGLNRAINSLNQDGIK